MAQHLGVDSLTYEKEYNAFMTKLKNFHESKGWAEWMFEGFLATDILCVISAILKDNFILYFVA